MSIDIKVFPKGQLEENTYLVTDKETGAQAIIDPGYIGTDITSMIDADNFRYLILTHAHGDHAARMMDYVREYPKAGILLSENEKFLYSKLYKADPIMLLDEGITAEPEKYLCDGETIALGNSEITVINTPGHSEGSICLLTDGYLFSGDTLFYRSVGATHFPTGNWDVLQKSIRERLYTLDESLTVLPGHGEATTIGDEKRSNPFV